MNHPQTLKRLAAGAMVFAMLGTGQSFAAITPFAPTAKANAVWRTTPKAKLSASTKALIKIASTLKRYANEVVMKSVAKVADADARVQYEDEVKAIVAKLDEKSAQLSAGFSEPNASEVKADLKNIFFSLRAINKEVLAYKKGASPFVVATGSVAEVESLILGAQKDITVQLRDYLDKYKNGVKETGNLKFSVSAPQGKVSVNIERYVNLYALLTDAQEMDMKMTVDFSFANPSSITGALVSGAFVVDGNIKIMKDMVYFELKDYSITTQNATADITEMVNSAKAQLDLFKGKVVSVKMPQGAKNSNGIKVLYNMLSVLENQPLLTVKKENQGVFFLMLKKSTIDALELAAQDGVTTGYTPSNRVDDKIIAKMTKSGADFTLTFGDYPQFSPRDIVATLSKKAGAYTFGVEGKNEDKVVHMLIKKDFFDISLSDKTMSFVSKWENDHFSLLFTGENGKLKIAGKYNAKESDLAVEWNDKSIGYIRGKEEAANTYTWDMNIALPEPISATFQYVGKMAIEFAPVTITAPTNAVDIETIQK